MVVRPYDAVLKKEGRHLWMDTMDGHDRLEKHGADWTDFFEARRWLLYRWAMTVRLFGQQVRMVDQFFQLVLQGFQLPAGMDGQRQTVCVPLKKRWGLELHARVQFE